MGRFKKGIFICLFLFIFLTSGFVSASQDSADSNFEDGVNNADELSVSNEMNLSNDNLSSAEDSSLLNEYDHYEEIEPPYEMDCDYPYEMKYGEDEYFTLTSDKNDTNEYTLILTYWNSKGAHQLSYDIHLVNGTGKVSLSKVPICEDIDGMVVIKGTNKMVLVDIIFTVNGHEKLVGAKNLAIYYGDKAKFSVKVYTSYGKLAGKGVTIRFRIGKDYSSSKSYFVKTNSKGIASLAIHSTPQSYKIWAEYKNAFVCKKVVIKQVLTLKTIKVKKSAKKLVLTAVLKRNKTPIRSAKIIFKFNGKAYNAKTSKMGIAKVVIKKSAFKNLKLGKKVSYQAIYIKDAVTKSARVRR